MSKEIVIGKILPDANHHGGLLKLNVNRLMVSRMLITADSGGGKSWLLRKVLEGLSKSTQTIVFDPESEFATLREKRDMVLVGPDGEVPAEPKSAALLCRKLMELNLSAVIDLGDLAQNEQREFVSIFCNTLVALPRELWHPCFIAIDEIHEFAPEGEKSESEKAIARLSKKGRKRGFCLIGATQRIGDFSKNAAAGLKNLLIGTSSLDTDIKRSAASLGFGKDRYQEIQEMSGPGNEGEFFGLGPAFNFRGVRKVRSGEVETTHPKAGQGRPPKPPAPSAQIKGVLAEFADLPQQAEAEAKDMREARARIKELERQVKSAGGSGGVARGPDPAATAELRATAHELKRQLAQRDALVRNMRKGLEDSMKVIAEIQAKGFEKTAVDAGQVRKAVEAATDQIVRLVEQSMGRRDAEVAKLKKEAGDLLKRLQKLLAQDVNVSVAVQHNEPFTVATAPAPKARTPRAATGDEKIGKAELAILTAAIQRHPDHSTRSQLSILSGYSITSSSFTNALSALRARGYMAGSADDNHPTAEGINAAGDVSPIPTGDERRRHWMGQLGKAEAAILEVICKAHPDAVSREQVAEQSGYSLTSSSFTNALSKLRTLELIGGRGELKASDDLFD